MCRTAFAAVALAMLAMAGVESAQATQPAKTQRRSAAAGTTSAAHRQARFGSAGRAEPRERTYSNSHENLGAIRTKRTPEEVGREAGLAILREREGTQVRRRAVRVERRRSMRRPRLERAAWRSEERRLTRSADPSDAAGVYSAPDSGRAETDEAQSMDSRRISTEHEATPATRPTESEDSADAGTAAVERMGPGESGAEKTAADKRNDVAAEDGDETSPTALSGAGEAAGSAGAKTKGDIASLAIPRSAMPSSLRGSLESLQRQNDRLDAEGLERIENEADLAARIANKLLVPLPTSSALTVNPELEENHRYCRPWTAKFLADLARAHEAAFHSALEVNSAVRTVEYQKRLMETNGNAAPAEGDLVSPHLTGATIDIAKKGLNRAEMAWMRKQLAGLEAAGKIDVEEEFKQACFHITVYESYVPARKTGPAAPSKPATHSSTPRQTADPAGEPAARGA
jgi:hypothetical protein